MSWNLTQWTSTRSLDLEVNKMIEIIGGIRDATPEEIEAWIRNQKNKDEGNHAKQNM